MLRAFAQAFRTPDLRNKLLFSLAIMAIFRLGAFIPAPGVNYANVQICVNASNQSILNMVNLFSGGGLLQLSVFALGIMPYITASIIMQILGVVIPKLEQWQEQGAVGQRKITQWTRYLGVGIALLQATGITYLFHTGGGGAFGP